jgi:ABC-type nitrate/sulfonate/bicarbonate transport system substrate-binding protein
VGKEISQKKIYLIISAVVLVAVVLIFLGVRQKTATTQGDADQLAKNNIESGAVQTGKKYYEIRIPDSSSTTVFMPYVAEELGFFEEEGIKPIYTGVIPAGQQLAAVIAGSNETGSMHVNRPIVAIAGGAKIKCVVAGPETSEKYPHMEYIVLEDSDIHGPKDLIGKKVGVATPTGCSAFIPWQYLKKFTDVGDPRNSIEFITVPTGNEEVAMRAGEVDTMGFHGSPLDVYEHGGVRKIFDDYEVWGSQGGACPWYFREDYIEQNPEAVRGFVNAMAKASNWLNEHNEEGIQLQAKRKGVDPKSVTIYYEAPDGIITDESIQMWIDVLVDYGEIEKPIPLDQIFTNEFNDFAKK